MAPIKFAVSLDKGFYFPGNLLTGKVTLISERDINTKGLQLICKGEAKVKWYSGRKEIHEEECYFHTKQHLTTNQETIPSGESTYPFSFQLPTKLPSSFEGEYGHVRYSLEAKVRRPWKKVDYSTKVMFTVHAIVDLNTYPALAVPREVSSEKSVGYLFCKTGCISMTVEMPRTGYVPGEYVNFSVSSNNASSRPVSAVLASFVGEVTFEIQEGLTKSICDEIVKLRGPQIPPFENQTWESQFQIPPLRPTDLGGCDLIKVTYYAKFKLEIPNNNDLKAKVRIVVGTVPYTFLSDCRQNLQRDGPLSPDDGMPDGELGITDSESSENTEIQPDDEDS